VTIYETQPLWVPGAGLFLLYRLAVLRSIKLTVSQVIGAVAGLGLFQGLKHLDTRIAGFHSPKIFDIPEDLGHRIMSIPDYVYTNFTGSYYLGKSIEVTPITSIIAWVLTTLLFLGLLFGIYTLIKRKWDNPLLLVSGLAAVSSIGAILFLISYSARYLIPLSGFMMLILYFGIYRIYNHKLVNVSLAALIIAGAFSMVSFKDYQFENGNKKQLTRAIRTFKANKVDKDFSQEGLLQWQLMFYSQEEIIARYRYNTDRYEPYLEQVNAALEESNKNVGLIGNYNPSLPKNAPNLTLLGSQYFTYMFPSKPELEKGGFRFE